MGNFAFYCKKFFMLRLAVEMGFNNRIMGNGTYVLKASSEAEVVDELKGKMVAWGIKSEQVSSKIAPLYHNPKFHKDWYDSVGVSPS